MNILNSHTNIPQCQHPIRVLQTKIKRAQINQQYQAISRNREQKTRQNMTTYEYIADLQNRNEKLQKQLERQKQKHEKQINIYKERIKAKDSLLDQCQKQISHIRKQYQWVVDICGKGKVQVGSGGEGGRGEHRLLRGKKSNGT